MKLKIKAFGVTREIIGTRELELEVDDTVSVMELRRTLNERYPRLEGLRSLYVAVNNAYAEEDSPLQQNDEIALIPPVSGG